MANGGDGIITDEGIERLRLRVGYTAASQISGAIPFNRVAGSDAFRHFTNGYGDDNPLYCEPDYARRSPFGQPIAPPAFLSTMGQPCGPKAPPEILAQSANALPGVQAFQAGGAWEFYAPVAEGDRLATANFLTDVEDKRSSFGGGRSAIVHHRQVWWRPEDAQVVGQYHVWYVNTVREKASAARTEKPPVPSYHDDDLSAIDAAYASETRRGSTPLTINELEPGAALPGLVKGPLTVTDLISFHMGWGWSGQGTFATRLGWEHRRKRPHMWDRNEYGAHDVVQRGHWDAEMARRVGAGRSYDYGFLRTCWFAHAVTNWMGDGAWIARLEDRITRFNYVGDTTWITGTVSEIDAEAGRVIVELRATNQTGEETASARAEVRLPAPGASEINFATVPETAIELARRATEATGTDELS